MDFVAIDFETANERPSSACQLGVIIVEQGQVAGKREWLIRPEPSRFSSGNIAVHGITPDQVAGESGFDGIWDEIWEMIRGRILVAHNARFDIGVLRACLIHFGLEIPAMEFSCTRALARQAWPGLPGYGLRALADFQGIQFRHHDALEDAEACAKLVNAIAGEIGVSHFGEMEQQLGLTRGRAGAWGAGGPRLVSMGKSKGSYQGYRARGARSSHSGTFQRRLRFDTVAVVDDAHGDSHQGGMSPIRESLKPPREGGALRETASQHLAFKGANVVFTGNLRSLEREEAERLVQLAGGKCTGSVTRKTCVLVVGQPDLRTLRAGRSRSTKEDRAQELIDGGQRIEVLSEEQFFQRLRGTQEATHDTSTIQTHAQGQGGSLRSTTVLGWTDERRECTRGAERASDE